MLHRIFSRNITVGQIKKKGSGIQSCLRRSDWHVTSPYKIQQIGDENTLRPIFLAKGYGIDITPNSLT